MTDLKNKRGKKNEPKVIFAETDGLALSTLSNLELEQAVLGAVLLEKDALEQLSGIFTDTIFYYEQNRIIAKAIITLFLRNEQIDILTVTQQLKFTDELEKVGGAYYISSLTNRIASSAHIEYHARIIQQYALGRQINDVCNVAKYKLFNPGNDIFDTMEELQTSLENSLKDIVKYQVSKVADVHQQSLEKARALLLTGGSSGVPSGLREMDEITNGWQESDLVILAGRPGMGKTAFAISIMINATIQHSIPVAIFSLEMSKEQLVGRMQSSLTGINASRIIKKQLTEYEIEFISKNASDLVTSPLFIDDTPNISLVELKTKARKLVREDGVKMIIVDYLQLMRSGMQIQNREQEIAEISRGLKALAKELMIPVIALSQLSRLVETRADKKPQLSDLRESGQIEQDADMVIFCFRPEYYGITDYELEDMHYDTNGLFLGLIAKHRSGAIGEAKMTFLHKQIKVVNYGSNPFESWEQSTTFVEKSDMHNSQNAIQSSTNVLGMNHDFLNQGNTNVDDIPF
jgi:replicative DNA helicase